ncbi:MAG: hypothetical protein WCO86_02990, partial [Planctomycetota bacterium]
CTFFRLITGRMPFPGDNPLQVLMARCSKDAPSARTHRPEIPEVVDDILRRITMRDPTARFQTAAELVTALTPFCSELTQKSLRDAMQEAGLDDTGFVLNAATGGEVDSQDPGYHQFLKEMDSGAAVDLMLATSGGNAQALSATSPFLPQVGYRPVNSRTSAAKINRRTVTIAMVSSGALIVLAALYMFMNRHDVRNPQLQEPAEQDSVAVIPRGTLKPADPVTVQGG